MKKALMAAILAVCVILTSCGDWSLSYSKQAEYEGWSCALDPEHHRAFVSTYVWEGDMSEEGRRIVIPEMVEDCKVMKLGGYFGRGLPMPFSVVTPALRAEEGEVINPEDPRPLVFTLVVNKSLEKIDNVRIASSNDAAPDRVYLQAEDGKLYAYDIYWRSEVDPENKTFCEKDGKLYQKSGNSLVTAFYWEK